MLVSLLNQVDLEVIQDRKNSSENKNVASRSLLHLVLLHRMLAFVSTCSLTSKTESTVLLKSNVDMMTITVHNTPFIIAETFEE